MLFLSENFAYALNELLLLVLIRKFGDDQPLQKFTIIFILFPQISEFIPSMRNNTQKYALGNLNIEKNIFLLFHKFE